MQEKCVCVCVCERERERERDCIIRGREKLQGETESERSSVTRFVKFCRFGTILKLVLSKFVMIYLVFGKKVDPTAAKCFTIGQFFIVVDGQIL